MGLIDYIGILSAIGPIYTSLPAFNSTYKAATAFSAYEDITQKAAKYSRTAEDQLWLTRNSMAAAGVTVTVSLISSLFLVLNSVLGGAGSIALGLAGVNLVCVMGVNSYVGRNWRGAARIPGATEYNVGVRETERTLRWFGKMAVAWVGVTGVAVVKALVDRY